MFKKLSSLRALLSANLSNLLIIVIIAIFLPLLYALYAVYNSNLEIKSLNSRLESLASEKNQYLSELQKTQKELEDFSAQDQVKINQELAEEIKNIQKTYNSLVDTYESLLDLKEKTNKTKVLDETFAKAISDLSKKDYESATQKINELNKKIKEEETKLASNLSIPTNVPQNNTPPASGYSRQQVNTDIGSFMVSLIAADISTTRVIVDTASDSDCTNNCPVLPLSTYVSRNGGFAGINGTYFCPATYPSCANKTNSFDLLVMNKNKHYFNSSNNVYSNNPAVIFGNGYIRFVSSASQWGRDTSVDGVISNYPLLLENGNIRFGGDDDPKKGSKGNRSFVANKGNIVFIGVVHNATVAESARVL
ncbi:MAG: hypothetical protein NZM26_00400, partial [Patescibacteria group bacterium]|nr:hypothetical protein [Patescibacteria group bacterium]